MNTCTASYLTPQKIQLSLADWPCPPFPLPGSFFYFHFTFGHSNTDPSSLRSDFTIFFRPCLAAKLLHIIAWTYSNVPK